jgi:hypothetical protein
VVAAAHQAQFHLVLHIFNVKGATARARAHQRADDLLGQCIDHLAHAGRCGALGAMHGQKGLHHGHGNLVGLEGHHGAVAANDLVVGQWIPLLNADWDGILFAWIVLKNHTNQTTCENLPHTIYGVL